MENANMKTSKKLHLSEEDCLKNMVAIKDALDVIGGKWKLIILVSIMHGRKRFTEIEKSIPNISSKVLAKELKDLEMNKLITRVECDDYPVRTEYLPTDYVFTLETVITSLHMWGINHRDELFRKRAKQSG